MGGFETSGVGITDVDDLEPNGFWNPLVDGSYERAQAKLAIDGAFLLEGTVEEDATTTRKDIKLKGGIIPEVRTPDSGELVVSMQDTHILSFSSSIFVMRQYLSSDELPIDSSELGSSIKVRARLKWLESVRVSGTAVDLDAETQAEVEAAIEGNRVYEFEQADGEDIRFTAAAGYGVVFLQSSRVMHTYYSLASDNTGTFDAESFAEALDDVEVTLDGVDTPAERPPFGSTEIEVDALRLNMDNMTLENAGNHAVVQFTDENSVQRRLILGNGITVDYSELSTVSSKKQMPRIWGVNAIHFGADESADGIIRLLNPVEQIAEPGNDWVCTFHNRNTTQKLEIDDWDNDNLATLLPGEKLSIRMTRRMDGTGEMIEAVPFIRRVRMAQTALGDFNVNGFYVYSSSPSRRARPLRRPTESGADVYEIHEDAFQFGTGSYTSGTSLFGTTTNNVLTQHALIFQKSGKVRFRMNVLVSAGGSSGVMPDDHGLGFVRTDGSSIIAGPYLSNQQMGVNENENWALEWEFDAEYSDGILPFIRYPLSGVTLSLSNLQHTYVEWSVEMRETINKEYTP